MTRQTMTRLAVIYGLALLGLLTIVNSGGLSASARWINEVPLADKVVHFIAFGLLALFTNGALVAWKGDRPFQAVATGSLSIGAIATLEEWSNSLVTYRTSSLADLAANYLGILFIGTLPLALWLWSRREARRGGWLEARV